MGELWEIWKRDWLYYAVEEIAIGVHEQFPLFICTGAFSSYEQL